VFFNSLTYGLSGGTGKRYVIRKSKYSDLNIIWQAVIVLSYYFQIYVLADFWSSDATTNPASVVGHNACW